MPELPDVEGFRRALAEQPARASGPRRRRPRRRRYCATRAAQKLARELGRPSIRPPRRHGKWLILPTDGPTLLIHSGMTGHPYFAVAGDAEEGQERLVISA